MGVSSLASSLAAVAAAVEGTGGLRLATTVGRRGTSRVSVLNPAPVDTAVEEEDAGRRASTADLLTISLATAPCRMMRTRTGPAEPHPASASAAASLATWLQTVRPRTSCASTVDREVTFPQTVLKLQPKPNPTHKK